MIPCLSADEIQKRLLKTPSQLRFDVVMPRIPAIERSLTAESQKRLLKTFDHPRFNTVIPCLPADEILKRLLKTLSQQRSETVITRLPTDENSITVENKKGC